jgi:hypothetical protein
LGGFAADPPLSIRILKKTRRNAGSHATDRGKKRIRMIKRSVMKKNKA